MRARGTGVVDEALSSALEAAVAGFDPSAALARDPLSIVRSVPAPEREMVAVITACMAYGAAGAIRSAVGRVLSVLGPSPTRALRDWQPGRFVELDPDFVYRMTRSADVDALLTALAVQLERHGSVEGSFEEAARLAGHHPGTAQDASGPLGAWVAALRGSMPASAGRGARYLTPDPSTGSACKRWHLMLRWLVRPDDGLDLGLWSVLRPYQLLLPLDTHTGRLVYSLGLSDRRTVDYRMAREATDTLLRVDATDPIRFDMPLCHLGMSGACRHRYASEICGVCSLRGVCRWI